MATLYYKSLSIWFSIRHHLFIVIYAKNSVVDQVKFVPNTKSLMTSLAGEAFQMVDILSRPHHHFKRGNGLTANSAEAFCSKQPNSDKI